MHRGAIFAVLALLAIAPSLANAASIRISPLSIERIAPAATGALSLTNTGIAPVRVQLRIFRWVQVSGIEQLMPTRDVVVSPPASRLDPGVNQTIRIVRVAKRPVQGEETYRLLVDELPGPNPKRRKTVNFLLRYSVPVFFTEADAEPADVAWRVRYAGGRFEISAANTGQMRMKLSQMALRDANGTTYRITNGLLGYVLGGATMKWSLPAVPNRPPRPGDAHLRLVGEEGVTDVPVGLRSGGG